MQENFGKACILLACGLAKTFGNGEPLKWHTGYKPISDGRSIGATATELKECQRWPFVKERIKQILTEKSPPLSHFKISNPLCSDPPSRITFCKETAELIIKKSRKVVDIDSRVSLEELLAQLDQSIPVNSKSQNTPATGATQASTPGSTLPPPTTSADAGPSGLSSRPQQKKRGRSEAGTDPPSDTDPKRLDFDPAV